ASVIRLAVVAVLVPEDFVMRLRSAFRGEGEPFADLDPLHGLGAHERPREPRVEPVLLRRVRAETGRNAPDAHFDHPADGVALAARFVDPLFELLGHDTSFHLDADDSDERLRDRPRGDDARRMTRARALERVPDVVQPVLHHAGQVGVTGPRERDGFLALSFGLALRRPRAHPPRPVLVVAVPDDECERGPERPPVAQAREDLDLVLLDLLPGAATVPLLPTAKVG